MTKRLLSVSRELSALDDDELTTRMRLVWFQIERIIESKEGVSDTVEFKVRNYQDSEEFIDFFFWITCPGKNILQEYGIHRENSRTKFNSRYDIVVDRFMDMKQMQFEAIDKVKIKVVEFRHNQAEELKLSKRTKVDINMFTEAEPGCSPSAVQFNCFLGCSDCI